MVEYTPASDRGAMVTMPADDEEYFTLAEAMRRAGLRSSGSLYKAMKSGRLKTVTTMAGAHVRRLTTQAWLDAYLAGRSNGQRPGPTPDDSPT